MTHDTTNADHPISGRWLDIQKTPGDSQTIGDGFGVFAVHAALLHTGKVLLWSGRAESGQFLYASWIWDPVTNTESGPQPFNGSDPTGPWSPGSDIDLFCCHQVFLEDGRLLAIGGAGAQSEGDARGSDGVWVFDPLAGTDGQWSKVGDMAAGRWYPTAVLLPDGRVGVFSGWDHNQDIVAQPEVLSPPGYTPQPVTGGDKPLPIYPGLHLVRGGAIFYTGTSWRYTIDPAPTSSFRMIGDTVGGWTEHTNAGGDPLYPNERRREEGTSVLLPPAQAGRILVIGGGHWFGGEQHGNNRSVEILETQGASPSWMSVGNMHHARINVNAVLLPDGKVLILGGHNRHKFNHDDGDEDPEDPVATPPGGHVLKAELFDPEVALDPTDPTDPFVDTGRMHRARMYHSVALLLADGSVFTAGGDDSHAPATTPGEPLSRDQKNFEIYQPPYFFRGVRPRISDSLQTITYGRIFRVYTPDALRISDALLIRPMAITHHTDTEQRYVTLRIRGRANGWLAIDAPVDPTVAPPGYYMLFIKAGDIPSVASFVRLS